MPGRACYGTASAAPADGPPLMPRLHGEGSPPHRGDEVGRVFAAQVHEDPDGGLGRIFAALGRVLREARMPRAAALRLDLNRDPAGVGEVGGENVDAGHVACERDRVPSPPVDFRRDEHLPGTRDLLRIHLSSDYCPDRIPVYRYWQGRIRWPGWPTCSEPEASGTGWD